MRRTRSKHDRKCAGFSILEMLIATVILLVGLVAVAQLVPASIFLNQQNRASSAALVFAQRELDQMLDQPLTLSFFTDTLGNTCQLGTPATPNAVQGSSVLTVNNQVLMDFSGAAPAPAPTNGYGFTYSDPTDPTGTTYDIRWAVVLTGNGTTVSSRRIILGVRQVGGNGLFQPTTLDTTVGK